MMGVSESEIKPAMITISVGRQNRLKKKKLRKFDKCCVSTEETFDVPVGYDVSYPHVTTMTV